MVARAFVLPCLLLVAAWRHPAVRSVVKSKAPETGRLWTHTFPDEIIGIAGGRLWAWDRGWDHEVGGISELDLGGYVVSFSPKSHDGSRFVDIGVVGKTSALVF